MMMKEHIVDNYGEIKYTMGNGCSGGSIQQNTVASIYPGLLDGIQPSCDFPDSITTGHRGHRLRAAGQRLRHARVDGADGRPDPGADQRQEGGDQRPPRPDRLPAAGTTRSASTTSRATTCPTLVVNATTGAIAPVGAPRNNCLLPAALVYDPVTNPTGTRCGDPDLAAAVWGTTDRPARRAACARCTTSDNVGVQYGLKALLAGAITAEEFVTLNEKVGGIDADSNRIAARSVADTAALDIAYRAGIVSSGKNLGKVADHRLARLRRAGRSTTSGAASPSARASTREAGGHDNQVIWRYGTGLLPATAAQVAAVTMKSFLTMDTWLSSLLTSAPKATLNAVRTQAQVVAGKPAAAVDLCYLTGDATFATPVTDKATCDADPRLAVLHARRTRSPAARRPRTS